MSTNYHTDIAVGAAANASVFNAPLGTLDTAITANATSIAGLSATVTTVLNSVILGGAAVTLTNGAASAAQKVVTVDSSAQFVAGCYVEYTLVGGVVERNTVDTVDSPTQITLITNIGTGGIADNSPVAVIPVGFYNSQAGVFNVMDYGASPSASAAVNAAAIQAAIDAAGAGIVLFPGIGTYQYDTCLDVTGRRTGVTLRAANTYGTFLEYTGTGGNCIDLTHSAYVRIENITLTVITGTPEVGVLMGRNASGDSAGNHRLTNVIIQGPYTKAGIYSCSSEVNHFDNVHVYQTGGINAYAYYHSDTNDLSAASAYETITALAANATNTTFVGGVFCNWTAVTGGRVMHFKNTTNLSMIGTYMQTDGTPAIGTLTLENVAAAFLSGIRQEGAPSYGVHVVTLLSSSTIIGCYLSGTAAAIYGANSSTIQFSTMLGITPAGTTQIVNAATFRGSLIDIITLDATVRTSAHNNIWLNSTATAPALTGGVGNTQFSQWGASNERMILSSGGVFTSDLGWGIEGAADATGQAVGALQKKVIIYDEEGTVLGYVPIYAAFTGP